MYFQHNNGVFLFQFTIFLIIKKKNNDRKWMITLYGHCMKTLQIRFTFHILRGESKNGLSVYTIVCKETLRPVSLSSLNFG